MPTTVHQNYTETVTYNKVVQFTVAHKHDSAYSRDGGKTRINTSMHKNILSEDRVVLSKKFVDYFNDRWGSDYLVIDDTDSVKTSGGILIGAIGSVAYKRYIKGENSIWKAEQDKLGIKPTRDDGIYMLWGAFQVDAKSKPTDKGLWIYLLVHNANQDFELRDDSISAAAFKIQDDGRDARQAIEERDDKVQEAREIVYQLRNRKTNRYDKDKMNFYTNVFRTQISGFDDEDEKFKILLNIADTTPDVIINGVNQENVNYLQVIQQALALDILVIEKGKCLNTMTKNSVVTFKVGTSEPLVIEKMVDYYASKDGANEFEHLRNSVEAVRNTRLNP